VREGEKTTTWYNLEQVPGEKGRELPVALRDERLTNDQEGECGFAARGAARAGKKDKRQPQVARKVREKGKVKSKRSGSSRVLKRGTPSARKPSSGKIIAKFGGGEVTQ